MSKDFVGNGNDDGTVFGRTSGKIGFYGLGTPITIPTIINATDAATAITGASSIYDALVALGLCE